MEATAYFKNIHISPKKLRFMLPSVKKMTPAQSLNHLMYAPQKSARIFYKAIKSAIDNAKFSLKVSEDVLKFKVLTVEQGNVLKRYRPGGRGTAKPYKRKFSHIKIVLEAAVAKKAKAAAMPAKKEEAVKAEAKSETPKLKVDATKKKVVKAEPKKAKQEVK